MVTRTALAAIAVAALTLPVGLIAPATASHGGGDDVRTKGRCSGSAHWKLKAKPDNGRIEIEGEIDSNRSGQVWHWKLKHNGSSSAKGSKRTAGRSGSFEVRRRMANLSGKDQFTFRATHGGQVCRGTISY
ncbi:hypothetical protein [Nocardioides sp.]|jgi:hypothetical protein|uniref:hypothetical protein n=1 Tax=Nocardioides sp. TaxID=35761 RepID=UPI002F3FE21E